MVSVQAKADGALNHLPKYLSKFMASKFLGVSVFVVDTLVKKGVLKTYKVDRFDDKISLEELQACKMVLENPEKYRSKPVVSIDGVVQKSAAAISQGPAEAAPHGGSSDSIDFDYELMDKAEAAGFIHVREDAIVCYCNVQLYFQSSEGNYVIYKDEGKRLTNAWLATHTHPDLYIKASDKIRAAAEVNTEITAKLGENLETGDGTLVRENLSDLYANIIECPDAIIIESMVAAVEAFTADPGKSRAIYSQVYTMFSSLTVHEELSSHSINVMVLAFQFCIVNGYSPEDSRDIVLCALLHDIGRVALLAEMPRDKAALVRLEDDSESVRAHVEAARPLLEQIEFPNPLISWGILEHHERLDGSGMPTGASKLSEFGQLIGIVDTYELKRRKGDGGVQHQMDILQSMKRDVEAGLFNKDLYKQFVYSLI